MRRKLSLLALYLACACLLLHAAARPGLSGPDSSMTADSLQPLGTAHMGLLRFEPEPGRSGSPQQQSRAGAPGSWPIDTAIAALLALPLWCRSAPLRRMPARSFLQHALIPHSIHAPPTQPARLLPNSFQ